MPGSTICLTSSVGTRRRTERVEDLLRRNAPPLEVELADLRNVIEKTPEILRDIDDKIAHATAALEHLVNARTQAESHFKDARAILHPARQLPTEVLREILSYCLKRWDRTDNGDSMDALLPLGLCRTSAVVGVTLFWLPHNFGRMWSSTLNVTSLCHIGAFCIGLDYTSSALRNVICTSSFLITSQMNPHPAFALLELSAVRWNRVWFEVRPSTLDIFRGNTFPRMQELRYLSEKWPVNLPSNSTFHDAPHLHRLIMAPTFSVQLHILALEPHH